MKWKTSILYVYQHPWSYATPCSPIRRNCRHFMYLGVSSTVASSFNFSDTLYVCLHWGIVLMIYSAVSIRGPLTYWKKKHYFACFSKFSHANSKPWEIPAPLLICSCNLVYLKIKLLENSLDGMYCYIWTPQF